MSIEPTKRSVALAWHYAHPDRSKAAAKRWDAAHPGERLARSKEWHAARPDYTPRWKKANPEKVKAYNRASKLKAAYGITIKQFEALLLAQGGGCAVCGGPAKGRGAFHVDHDHTTGAIRGLLCHGCNVTLGVVEDSVERLHQMVAYLQRPIAGKY